MSTMELTTPHLRPRVKDIKREIRRIDKKTNLTHFISLAINFIIVLPAAIVLITNIWVSILMIDSSSMVPTLEVGDIVFSLTKQKPKHGDIISFTKGAETYIKRVMGFPGDEINVTSDNYLMVNGQRVEEPYIIGETFRDSFDIKLPYIVPDNCYFVLGDNREDSKDSRLEEFGAIHENQITGVIQFMRIRLH